jgi:hypothetical protein
MTDDLLGRGGRIRTYDLLLPKQARYRATLHPENSSAEGEGFEPSVPFPVRQFSKLLVSATHPSLRTTGYCR